MATTIIIAMACLIALRMILLNHLEKESMKQDHELDMAHLGFEQALETDASGTSHILWRFTGELTYETADKAA